MRVLIILVLLLAVVSFAGKRRVTEHGSNHTHVDKYDKKQEGKMAAKKGSCGGTPRVGKKGDAKPRRGSGRGRR